MNEPEPPPKRAKMETSVSQEDTQGVLTPFSMDNADSVNRRLSKQASGKDAEVPKKWFVPGEQDFKIIKKVDAFADHTLLIEKLLNCHTKDNRMSYEPVLITAPRRFGKSSNLSMVKYFLEIQRDEHGKAIKEPGDLTKPVKDTKNYELFAGMKIMEHTALVDQHFGRHPVIHLDFKDAEFSDPDELLMHCRVVLHNAIIQHVYLYEKLDEAGKIFFSSWSELNYEKNSKHIVKQSVLRLAKYLFNYFQRKVFILVDEYDAIFREAIHSLKRPEVERANRLIMTMLGPAIKGSTEYVQGAMLTGISYIAGIGMSNELNNVQVYRFLDHHKFVEFYGYTESEVKSIAEIYAQTYNLKNVFQQLTNWYNGYETQHGKKIYSVWSVGNTFEKRAVENYWKNTGEFYYLVSMLKTPQILSYILELLNGKDLIIELKCKISVDDIMGLHETMKSTGERIPKHDLLFSMMLEEGYLTMVKSSEEQMQVVEEELQIKPTKIKVRLPNGEIRAEIDNVTKEYFESTWGFDDVKIEQCARFFENVKSFGSQDASFTLTLKQFHKILTSLFEGEQILQMNESHLHCLMYYISSKAHYRRSTEHWLYDEAKAVGRLDLLMLRDSDFGIIVELKCNKTRGKGKKGEKSNSSLAALEQILNDKTKYMSALKEHNIEKYFLIGISIDSERNPSISCLLNKTHVSQAEHLPDYQTASCT